MVLGICSNILEEMKNFQLDRFRFIVTGFISERAEQGLAYKSYAVTDTAVDDHFTNEFKTFGPMSPVPGRAQTSNKSGPGRLGGTTTPPYGVCQNFKSFEESEFPWKSFEIQNE